MPRLTGLSAGPGRIEGIEHAWACEVRAASPWSPMTTQKGCHAAGEYNEMIALEEVTIGEQAIEVLGLSLKAPSARDQDRPADLFLRFEGTEVREAGFAEMRYDAASGGLVARVEIGRWGNLVLLMGMKKWLIFNVSPLVLVETLELHRAEGEDSGFHRVDFLDQKSSLIAVYESGVAALANSGKLMWHRKKYWDDEFLQISAGRLIFLSEGRRFAFDCSSGGDVAAD